ncbi:hypothetical protein ACO22_06191 [Paracoccidioides brasiliensis]|uniref:EXPERA domain-containing protein n=1 Tax=Paracoccidioides brasiliensis TaxID=121759 RepID=A0A1D2J851_PARBR|nr:hypothetical protein ACO22_06191 [Paracoccidioides brasiliensis]
MSTTLTASGSFTADVPTILCVAVTLSLLPIAGLLTILLIPSTSAKCHRILFCWHAYDALTHFIVEGSFLYNCFFTYTTIDSATARHIRNSPFLNHPQRLYGAAYGTGPMARLWQEYGKADSRWLGADAGIVSLELLTVFLGGPAATYICYLVYKSSSSSSLSTAQWAKCQFRMWFVAAGLAVAELYGGFMTFAPEWLTGKFEVGSVGHSILQTLTLKPYEIGQRKSLIDKIGMSHGKVSLRKHRMFHASRISHSQADSNHQEVSIIHWLVSALSPSVMAMEDGSGSFC